MWWIYRFRLLVVVPGTFAVWMTVLMTAPPWEAQNHTNTLQFKKHTRSTASHVVNQCWWEASLQLLAIWAVGLKKKMNINIKKIKNKKHTSSIDTNVRVPWLSKCSRQVYETILFFLFYSVTSCCCYLKSSSSNSMRVLLSSRNYSKALAPAVTP